MSPGYRASSDSRRRRDTGSRLGLRAMDIPASIDVIDSTVMQTRGFQRIGDALETVPGVLAGHHPAAPSSFSVRGFTRSQITVLRDGVWLGPANMVMRPQNAFNLDRVELLRGPASVLNGQGAVAGTVNAVTPAGDADGGARVERAVLVRAVQHLPDRRRGERADQRLAVVPASTPAATAPTATSIACALARRTSPQPLVAARLARPVPVQRGLPRRRRRVVLRHAPAASLGDRRPARRHHDHQRRRDRCADPFPSTTT